MLEKLKKPKAILFDVSGTLANSSFIPNVLVPYFASYHKLYLEDNFEKVSCQDIVQKLSVAANCDSNSPKIQLNSDKATVINSVCEYVNYCINNNKENKPLVMFRFCVWFEGYDKDRIQTPVYSDVAIQIQRWRLSLNIKLFVLSNGWNIATRKFMEKTSQGDLTMLIQDYFDTEYGPLHDPNTLMKIIAKTGEKAEDLLFLTKSPEEARAAKQVAMDSILVITHSKDVETIYDSCKDIPIVRTFNDISFIE